MKQGFQLQTRQQLSLSMTPQMIQSISMMALSTEELIYRIYEEVEKNPALEIVKESSYKDVQPRQKKEGSPSSQSDEYQAFLESLPSKQKSLKEHLLSQLSFHKLSDEEKESAKRIINNLSDEGFHLVDFDELFAGAIPKHLEKILALIQHFEPVGLATSGVQESLLVQALSQADSTPLVIALLKLEPDVFTRVFTPFRPTLITKKLNALDEPLFQNLEVKELEEALDFIKNLDPHPARDFSLSQASYVIPDIKIRRATADEKDESGEDFVIELLRGVLPELAISKSFENFRLDKTKEKSKKDEERFVKEAVQDASWFLNVLAQRTITIVKVARLILQIQKEFFQKGSPVYLKPLRMKDLADEIEVSESTISRIANNKYLACDWGILPFKFFFTTEVATSRGGSESRESVKEKIREILADDNANISDQKLADKLALQGIKIARRTVAKYRSELDIASSFDR